MDFELRQATRDDEGFVAQTFVSVARLTHPKAQRNRMPNGALTHFYYQLVSKLIQSCETTVAALPSRGETTSSLAGFSIVEQPNTVHMVYVSKAYWRMGLGRRLLSKVSVSDCVFRLWPNTQVGGDTEWIWGHLEDRKKTFLPYWLEGVPSGRAKE